MSHSYPKFVHLLVAPFLILALLAAMPEADARKLPSRDRGTRGHSSLSLKSSTGMSSRGARTSRSHRARQRKNKRRVVAVKHVQQEVGALVISEHGEVVMDQLSDVEFNPASVAKIVTAYGALKAFGPDYRFKTSLYIDGAIDQTTGTLNGNVYVQGCDPDFDRKDAASLGQMLLDAGVKRINGKVIVTRDFSYCSTSDAGWSANALLRNWLKKGIHIAVRRGAAVGVVPETAVPSGEYESEVFRDTLKEMLSYSQNGVAEQIGRVVGGIRRLEEVVGQESGLKPGAIKLASASGLGRSRVKPKDMMVILKALRGELQRQGLDFQDIFPVAGIDPGTLDERFTDPSERGSVIGKTGTLPGTDGGTSTLVGMFRSQKEDLYFVIFCWKGNVVSFRHQQDDLIRQLQAARGGPKPFDYRNTLPDGV